MVAIALLLRRRNQAVSWGIDGKRPLSTIADRIESSQRAAIAEARQLSRAAGFARLRSEAAAVGAVLGSPNEAAVGEVPRDLARARAFSRSYAARWFGAAAMSDGSIAESARRANKTTLGSLRRIAVTESSEAFSSGRARYIRLAPPSLLRVWDAQLDRRVCPICSQADGTIVGAREPFPLGEPGGVHPWCRCSWTLITATEARDVLYLEAA